ncbi:MAG: DUF3096 domain-containing protein [Candidatus Pacearchaeota archaeon]|nr:DUF3096 domain-containing protein [Candidatus Pacearchaeota archaeon]
MAIIALTASSLIMAILTILFGVLILVFPKLLRWIIGLYLLVSGLVALILLLI